MRMRGDRLLFARWHQERTLLDRADGSLAARVIEHRHELPLRRLNQQQESAVASAIDLKQPEGLLLDTSQMGVPTPEPAG